MSKKAFLLLSILLFICHLSCAQTKVDWKQLKNTPTSISGYGITTFDFPPNTVLSVSGINAATGTVGVLNSNSGTIGTLSATSETVGTLNAGNGTISTLNSGNGTISTLHSTNGTIGTLSATNGTINNLTVASGTVNRLTSNNGTIAALNSTTGVIGYLTVQNLLGGSVSAVNYSMDGWEFRLKDPQLSTRRLQITPNGLDWFDLQTPYTHPMDISLHNIVATGSVNARALSAITVGSNFVDVDNEGLRFHNRQTGPASSGWDIKLRVTNPNAVNPRWQYSQLIASSTWSDWYDLAATYQHPSEITLASLTATDSLRIPVVGSSAGLAGNGRLRFNTDTGKVEVSSGTTDWNSITNTVVIASDSISGGDLTVNGTLRANDIVSNNSVVGSVLSIVNSAIVGGSFIACGNATIGDTSLPGANPSNLLVTGKITGSQLSVTNASVSSKLVAGSIEAGSITIDNGKITGNIKELDLDSDFTIKVGSDKITSKGYFFTIYDNSTNEPLPSGRNSGYCTVIRDDFNNTVRIIFGLIGNWTGYAPPEKIYLKFNNDSFFREFSNINLTTDTLPSYFPCAYLNSSGQLTEIYLMRKDSAGLEFAFYDSTSTGKDIVNIHRLLSIASYFCQITRGSFYKGSL